MSYITSTGTSTYRSYGDPFYTSPYDRYGYPYPVSHSQSVAIQRQRAEEEIRRAGERQEALAREEAVRLKKEEELEKQNKRKLLLI